MRVAPKGQVQRKNESIKYVERWSMAWDKRRIWRIHNRNRQRHSQSKNSKKTRIGRRQMELGRIQQNTRNPMGTNPRATGNRLTSSIGAEKEPREIVVKDPMENEDRQPQLKSKKLHIPGRRTPYKMRTASAKIKEFTYC